MEELNKRLEELKTEIESDPKKLLAFSIGDFVNQINQIKPDFLSLSKRAQERVLFASLVSGIFTSRFQTTSEKERVVYRNLVEALNIRHNILGLAQAIEESQNGEGEDNGTTSEKD